MVGDVIPGLVVQESLRKQSEKATGNKAVSSIPPWLLHQLLPWHPLMNLRYVSEITPSPPSSFGSWCFMPAIDA